MGGPTACTWCMPEACTHLWGVDGSIFPMPSVRWVDLAVICVYVFGLTAVGLRFSRRQTSTERYFTAKRSVPSWAVGLSFLTAMVTSVTFIAFPGASYAGSWSLLVPCFLLLIVLVLVGSVVIPFYRRTVG